MMTFNLLNLTGSHPACGMFNCQHPQKFGKGIPAKMTPPWKCHFMAISTGKELPKISVDNTLAKERMRKGRARQTPTSLGILVCRL